MSTVHPFIKSLVISLTLHLVFGATSYALWHAMKSMPLSSKKLQKGEFLTASVEFSSFIPVQPEQTSKQTNGPNTAQQKSLPISHQKMKVQKLVLQSAHQHEGSTLSDIVPNPENKTPKYPEEARLTGREAMCIIKISIAPDGNVHTIDVQNDTKNCPAIFKREAKKAILTWHFSPHRYGYVERTIPIKFRLD